MDRSVLARKPMTELRDIAAHLDMRGYQKLRKADLIEAIVQSSTAGATPDGADAAAQPSAADAPEEGARKVLPPGAGRTDEPEPAAADADAEPDPAARAEPTPEPGTDDQRDDQPDGRSDGRSDGQADAGPDDERPGDRRPQGSRDRGGEGRDGGRPRRADPPSPAGDTAGEGEDEGSTRRSRRDRRKRNKGASDDAGTGGQPAPAPAPTAGGGGGQGGEPGEVRAGVLDILPEGYGFLRTTGYLPGERDVYVSQGQIRKHALRRGDVVQGPIRQQRSNEKVPALHHVQKVNGEPLEDGQVPARPTFEDLPISTEPARLHLAASASATDAVRLVDLVAPIGLGQRALVLAPPRAAKERLVRELGDALAETAPDAHVMLVLLDERPEVVATAVAEVDGEVIASTFDQTAEDHTQIAELAVERARRMVELGLDVIVLIDSVTRLARANGVTVQGSGRSIAPGVEAGSLYPVKRMLAAARRIEGGGSLTLVAVALTGTGSALDEVILQEVRRTATTEVVLDEVLTRRRVWPSISVLQSDTRDETALQDDEERAAVIRLRRTLDALEPADATALVLDKLAQTDSNEAFLAQLLGAGVGAGEGA